MGQAFKSDVQIVEVCTDVCARHCPTRVLGRRSCARASGDAGARRCSGRMGMFTIRVARRENRR